MTDVLYTTDTLEPLLRRAVALLEGFTGVAPALLTRSQAAAYLSVSAETIRLMRKRGQLSGVAVKIGAKTLYRRAGLDRVIGRLPAADRTYRPAPQRA